MGGRPRGGTSAIAHDAVKACIDRLEKRFPISRSGYFGIPGRGKKEVVPVFVGFEVAVPHLRPTGW